MTIGKKFSGNDFLIRLDRRRDCTGLYSPDRQLVAKSPAQDHIQ